MENLSWGKIGSFLGFDKTAQALLNQCQQNAERTLDELRFKILTEKKEQYNGDKSPSSQ